MEVSRELSGIAHECCCVSELLSIFRSNAASVYLENRHRPVGCIGLVVNML